MRNTVVSGLATALLVACSTGASGTGATGSATDPAPPSAGDSGVASGPSNEGGAPTSDAGGPAQEGGSCGQRGGTRGLTQRKLTVAGLARTYLVYLPPSLSKSTPAPFVYVFHGYTMSGQQMHDITQYAALADKKGIALVFPDGQGGPDSNDYPWNVQAKGQRLCGNGDGVNAAGDDFAFMDAMKVDVAQDQCLDPARTFATGFSMGGYFSHHVACYRKDIRAAAPHSGGTPADLSACTTGHVPMIIFHGTGDSVIAPGCEDPKSPVQSGFPASASLWAARNGCKATATPIPTDGAGGGKGTCYLYDGCPADGQVELCTFEGMDHCWAGGSTSGAGADSACPTYADATALEWAFFEKFAF